MVVAVSDLPPDLRALVERAAKARQSAYAPYSGFLVGAAVLSVSGAAYSGCNVENASYGLTMCAERVAAFPAVAAGEQRLSTIAVVGDLETPLPPCGACRQVLAELGPEATVVMANLDGKALVASMEELLPLAFRLPEGHRSQGR